MADQEYIVLRTQTLNTPSAENLGSPRAGPFGMAAGSEVESIEVSMETLSKNDRDDLRRDPRTQGMAQSMPLKLVEPTEVDDVGADAASGSPTWGVQAVGAVNSSFDGTGIKVAVLDTGIDPNHGAFSGVNLTRKNFTSEGDDDLHGHGTHCAGTIFGRDVNGTRIGVATGVTDAIIGKVLGQGGGSSAQLVEAIQWTVNEGAHIVSMSLGIDFPGFVKHLKDNVGLQVEPATSIALEQYRANINLFSRLADLLAAQNAVQQGTLIIAASGNESNRPAFEIAVAPPAAGSGIVAVGALAESTGNGHTVADFSNTECNISGPGVHVLSARVGGGLTFMSGTSMATPHAAGVAALWAQRQFQTGGGVLSNVLRSQLLAMADLSALVAGSAREDVGEGIIQAP